MRETRMRKSKCECGYCWSQTKKTILAVDGVGGGEENCTSGRTGTQCRIPYIITMTQSKRMQNVCNFDQPGWEYLAFQKVK